MSRSLDEIRADQADLHRQLRYIPEDGEEYKKKVKEVRALYKEEYAITGGDARWTCSPETLDDMR